MYQVVNDYRNQDALRASFNALAQRTFGIEFENWYQRGFWTDRYDPWSVVEDGKVIANVSVNRMDLQFCGRQWRLIQLGTVMTDSNYRNRGLIRLLMEKIEGEFADADGMFLFANDSVLDFYPKFGFRKASEYVSSKPLLAAGACRMVRVDPDDVQWGKLCKAMEESCFSCGCSMKNNPGLPFFYLLADPENAVYYCAELDAWAIARTEGKTLQLLDIYAKELVSIDAVASAFGGDFDRLELGFAPANPSGWECGVLQEENSTFFVKGTVFDQFIRNKLRIPVLGRA